MGCLVFSGLIFLAACGGSSSGRGGSGGQPGTPAGTYTITIGNVGIADTCCDGIADSSMRGR